MSRGWSEGALLYAEGGYQAAAVNDRKAWEGRDEECIGRTQVYRKSGLRLATLGRFDCLRVGGMHQLLWTVGL